MIVSCVLDETTSHDMKQHLKKIYNRGMYNRHVESLQRNETQKTKTDIKSYDCNYKEWHA